MKFSKLICLLLTLSSFLLPLNSMAIVEQPAFWDNVQAEGTKNNYNKFHFYFGTEEHETIDSAEELEAAVEVVFEIATEPVN